MSKLPIAGVAVTVIFNVALVLAPNISDEHKRALFPYTVLLLIAACIWWAWVFFKTHKPSSESPRHSTTATNVSGSNVAGRDIIFNHPPPAPTATHIPPNPGPSLSLNILTGAAEIQFSKLQPIEVRDLIDELIRDGDLLVSQWKTRLDDHVARQERQTLSTEWLSKVKSTVKKHLTVKQFDEVMAGYHNAMSTGNTYRFALDILNAGVKEGSDDYKLAFEIACKLEVLRRLRSGIT